ncbi:hypothetical protein MtrunA17_Chr1g0204791 [Medicago truncatula]|uniref:Epidermal patterning factor-like protein n=1 Tax=Medicago truncatula TaxID=3880 RepID=A0A072VQ74_MEDTR|nr:epidermal patterning factor-like protein [Medicago truncatula]RHN81967.1 hypothetical protein MtrunA17_Chr1g0204791 [Medicago truncatula]
MCVLRHPGKHHCFWLLPTFIFLLFSSSSAITLLAPQPSSSGTVLKHQKMENGSPTSPWKKREVVEQKKLAGPGSTPPSCRSKCSSCNPCQPVRMPVHPGLIIRLEYYPEAWRCKCGNKYFLP